MKLLQTIAGAFGLRAAKVPGKPLGDPALAVWFGGGVNTTSGAIVTPETALSVATVYACVRVITESVAMLPLFLYRREPDGRSRTKLYEHPLHRLLHYQPNRFQTAMEFWEMLVGHTALRGVAYAEKIATGGKGIAELMPLHPDRVRAYIAPNGQVAYEYTPTDGKTRVILHDEMFCLRGYGSEPLKPYSPIALEREAIGLAMTTEEFGGKMFTNGASVAGVLTHPEKMGDEAYTRFKKSWEERHSGAANAGKTAILEEGMKYEKIGMTAEDSQFLETRKYQRSEIASIFRVPPHMIGDVERSTSWGTGIEQQSLGFNIYTLQGWQTRIEQAIWRDLLTETEQKTHYAKFSTAALLRGDLKSRYDAYLVARQGEWLSADDVREMEDQNPIPDGSGTSYKNPLKVDASAAPTTKPDQPQGTDQ